MHPAAGRVAYGNNKPLLFKRRGLGRMVGIKSRTSKTPSFLFAGKKKRGASSQIAPLRFS